MGEGVGGGVGGGGGGWRGLMEEGEGQKEGKGFRHTYTLHVIKADEIKNKNHTDTYQKAADLHCLF